MKRVDVLSFDRIAISRPFGPCMAEPLIRVQAAGLRIGGLQVLKGVDLDIAPGEFVCVVGPSGSGKTTILRMIAGLVQPTEGAVTYRGEPILQPRPDVAVVFQDYGRALLPWRTAAGNVSLALEALGVRRADRAARIAQLLGRMGLGAHAGKYPGELSGGMQQRLQIARCLAQQPAALLMDEPFGALDAMTRQDLQDEILRVAAERSTTVFFVTHDLEEAIYLGDRVIGLQAGPGRVGKVWNIALPRPRNQIETREAPEFLKLRRELFRFIEGRTE